MANERISVEKADHVATLTLNRPAKHNAFDGLALEEFGQCMDELEPGRGHAGNHHHRRRKVLLRG